MGVKDFIVYVLLSFAPGQIVLANFEEGFKFGHLTTNDGLSNSQIHCIIQDRYGFIWIGTDNGLNRYDGLEFSVYKYKRGEPTALRGNTVNSIVELKDGHLLVGTSEGLHLYHQETDQFTYISLIDNYVVVKHIQQDPFGGVWVSTEGKGLFYSASGFQSFERIAELPTDHIQLTMMDAEGLLWIATRDRGVILLNPRTREVDSFVPMEGADPCMDIIEDSKKMIWLATEGSGIYLYNKFKHETTRLYKRGKPA